MSSQHPKSGIPVLTEILKTPAPVYGIDLPERRAAAPASAGIPSLIAPVGLPMVPSADQAPEASVFAPASSMPSAAPAPLPGSAVIRSAESYPDDAMLQRIRDEVRESVLQQLLGDMDRVLEQRIRDGLAEVLHTAVDGLANQLRDGLKMALDDVITEAVTQEMEGRRLSKK